ncbi:MAG: SpoIIE family protein phosphatase [Candidatus Omnitrophota bacterium]
MPFDTPIAPKGLPRLINYKKIFLYLGLTLLIVDVLSLSYFRILDRFELVTLDFRYNVRLLFPQKINPDIALIEIGEDTLQALGQWPLPRDYHAVLVDVLKKFKARQIVFDVLFCEPTGWDPVLVKSVRAAGNCYFPYAFRLKEKTKNDFFDAVSIEAPLLKEFAAAAKGTGFINKITDIDGKVRKAPLFIRYNNELIPAMTLKAASDYLGREPKVEPGMLDRDGCVLVNFAGRWVDTFKHYSYLDILAADQELSEGKPPRIDLSELKGKVCFIGLTATGTQEIGPVAVQSDYPMLGIHANLFNMLTEGVRLKRLGRLGNLSILILLSLLSMFLISRFRPYVAFYMSLGVISLLFVSAVLLFAFKGIWADIVCPAITLFIIYLVFTLVKYIGEIRAREKIQKELAVASSIQRCFLPAEIPNIPGLDIAAAMKTAKEVGGDLYDFVKFSDNRFGVMIGDVSGKGIPAALFMAKVDTLFRVYTKSEDRPSKTIEMLNNEIASDERSGLFTTVAYAVIDAKQKKLIFSDAGHLPVILVRGENTERLSMEDGMAVGIMEGMTFSEKAVDLSKGDIIMFYTDGASEARDAKGNEFGIERLIDIVKLRRDSGAQQIVNFILKELKDFQGKAAQHDDITVILVKLC